MMSEILNSNELEQLAQIGADDSLGDIAPTSIFTSIAATITVCSGAGWASLVTSVGVVTQATKLFSCTGKC